MSRRLDDLLERAGLPPLTRTAWVEVDVDGLVANAAALARLSHPAALAPVVKADGYGHGLEMAARCAVTGGARWLCVADAAEALRLRGDGYEGKVFVLYPVPAAMAMEMAASDIDVTVGDRGDARDLAGQAGHEGKTLSVHLEIDTGMTRGGVPPSVAVEVAGVIAAGPGTRLAGTWTHLAAPEDPVATREQLSLFHDALGQIETARLDPGMVHAAASGGLLATDTSGQSMMRPGLAFYGAHPEAGPPLPAGITPPLAVKAHAVRIAEVPSGTRVGYAGTWTATRPATIATLPIGYADGWSRSSSPGTSVAVAGGLAPVVGRISSDSLTVDVTGLPGVGPESEFTLLGAAPGVTVSDVARVRGTITWEVLQQLGARLARVYVAQSGVVAMRPESAVAVTPAPGARLPGY